jgi:hypothetical protein
LIGRFTAMEMVINIPEDLKTLFDHVVKEKFKGDAEKAVIRAVILFLQKEKEAMVDDEKFSMSLKKTLEMYHTRTERADSEFGDAFEKLKRRKSRAARFFDEITEGEED